MPSGAPSSAPVRVPVLDMALPNGALREGARAALSGTLSPVLALVNYGFEAAHAEAAAAVVAAYPAAHGGDALHAAAAREYSRNGVFVMHDPAGPQGTPVDPAAANPAVAAYVHKMQGLAERLVEICFFPDAPDGAKDGAAAKAALREAGKRADGRVSLRCYPGAGAAAGADERDAAVPQRVRLGAHVDGNLFTLLWASRPGLQILNSAAAAAGGVTPQDVLALGLPQIGPVDGAQEPVDLSGFMADVAPDAAGACPDYLLFSVGRAWLEAPLGTGPCADGVQCATLHQVQADAAHPDPRYSIPFLVDIHTA
eukprot:TRINITY_DN30246_c0_g1_i1.p2 TRINITY_DN30246_c0_g1~~TRINITY_DN30246_c0_g1_i1.p2  ORF type:complete len:312 (+),score=76.64 TRINITY_DN30246_c0_g1_i1:75-1010(+)